jgi:hypothetical protein
MKAVERSIMLTVCSVLLAALGCGVETGSGAEQTEQPAHNAPQPLAQARADALEEAASELKEARDEMRREHQSHEALNLIQREILELESQARFWRKQARGH